MCARFLAYLRLIDWCALSTSALILSIGLWSTASFAPPQDNYQYDYAQKAPDKESADVRPSTDDQLAAYTFWLMIFTGVLAASTIGLWIATYSGTRAADEATRTIERAYVTVSPPDEALSVGPNGNLRVRIRVTNNGRTPARVSHVFLRVMRDEPGRTPTSIPDHSPRPDDQESRGFLVTNAWFDITRILEDDTRGLLDEVISGRVAFWIYGYVDYSDVFKQLHRSGFGRIFNSRAGHLVFITSDAYNYDRPRVRGEGNDWNQTT